MDNFRVLGNLIIGLFLINFLWGFIFKLNILICLSYAFAIGAFLGAWSTEKEQDAKSEKKVQEGKK